MQTEKKTCKFYLEIKRRYCKFETYKGTEYCSHHLADSDLFVQCPVDPAHTVLASKLEKHIPVCPKTKAQKELESSVWYKKDINIPINVSNPIDSERDEEEIVECSNTSKKYLQDLIKNSPELFNKLLEEIPDALKRAIELYKKTLLDSKVEPQIDLDLITSEEYILDIENYQVNTDTSISDHQKDIHQCQDLVKTLEKYKLLEKNFVYIEFGAGKGGLSHYISEANQNESKHILIELEGRRHKMDKNHREDPNFLRIRANIKDFDINAVPLLFNSRQAAVSKAIHDTEETQKEEVKLNLDKISEACTPTKKVKTEEIKIDEINSSKKYQIIGVSKHMCGGASDLTIYSLLNSKDPINLNGFMISTCCHHRCGTDLYPNNEYLNQIGFDSNLHTGLFHITSWGIYHENPNKQFIKEADDSQKIAKTKIGKQAKRIIDLGRLLFLMKKGYLCYLIKYCDQVYSPENFVLIGKQAS